MVSTKAGSRVFSSLQRVRTGSALKQNATHTVTIPASLLPTRLNPAKFKAQAIVKGDSAITEYIEHKPLEGKIKLIDDPVVMMPRFIFTSMMNSLKKTMGELPAGGVNYRAYMEMGRENVGHYKTMGIDKPNILADMAFAFYSQMGWFSIIKTEWDEAAKTKTMTLSHTVSPKRLALPGKMYASALPGFLRELSKGHLASKFRQKRLSAGQRETSTASLRSQTNLKIHNTPAPFFQGAVGCMGRLSGQYCGATMISSLFIVI